VDAGATAQFTVTPNSGYQIASVTGCGGNLSGTTYTTGPITANCTVSASFDAITVIVTLDGPLTAQVGTPYSGVFQATGGTSPYVWAVLSGLLPPGLALTADGTISGRPTATGSYSFLVQATDRHGATGTGAFTIRVESVTVPDTPTGVSASDGTYTDRVQVTWNAVRGTTYYEVYEHQDGTNFLGQSTSANFDHTDATPGVIYPYYVRACNHAGCSQPSNSDRGYIRLSVPTGGNVVCQDFGFFPHCTYSWNAVSGLVYYYELYDLDGTQTTTEATSVTLPIAARPISRVRACGLEGTICSDFMGFLLPTLRL
jgi:Rieske Fe-S protein